MSACSVHGLLSRKSNVRCSLLTFIKSGKRCIIFLLRMQYADTQFCRGDNKVRLIGDSYDN